MTEDAHQALEPLAPVVGGVVDPDDLVGRDREVFDLLQHVSAGGAYVTGDRRRGKTSVLRRVARDLRVGGHVVISVSAETEDLASFNESFLHAVRGQRIFEEAWASWMKEFTGEVRLGTSGNGFRLSGSLSKAGGSPKELDIIRLCTDAAKKAGASSVVIVIDEVAQLAWFLHESDPNAGAELLRTFRRIRQDESLGVRVVLAGSVGLHHAVDDRTAINDLPVVEVGNLEHQDAVLLARRLMLGVCGREDADAADRLAAAVDDLPYYVQCLVSELNPTSPLEEVDWTARVQRAIDANDWETDHYVVRLQKYYPEPRFAMRLLDELARAYSDTGLSVNELTRLLSSDDDPPDEAQVSKALEKLRLDHYVRFTAGQYRFISPLVREVWLRARRRLR